MFVMLGFEFIFYSRESNYRLFLYGPIKNGFYIFRRSNKKGRICNSMWPSKLNIYTIWFFTKKKKVCMMTCDLGKNRHRGTVGTKNRLGVTEEHKGSNGERTQFFPDVWP